MSKLRIWESSSGRLTLGFTKAEIYSVPASGPADIAIERLMQSKRCMLQFTFISDSKIIAILQEYGAWEDLQIVDRKTNIGRLLWIAILDMQEADNPCTI
mgnify:FL=1